jgi:hypothetical protein
MEKAFASVHPPRLLSTFPSGFGPTEYGHRHDMNRRDGAGEPNRFTVTASSGLSESRVRIPMPSPEQLVPTDLDRLANGTKIGDTHRSVIRMFAYRQMKTILRQL